MTAPAPNGQKAFLQWLVAGMFALVMSVLGFNVWLVMRTGQATDAQLDSRVTAIETYGSAPSRERLAEQAANTKNLQDQLEKINQKLDALLARR